MRDEHYREHLAIEIQEIPGVEDPEKDEIQPLLFDLVKADKVDAVRALQKQFLALPRGDEDALRKHAASFGSTAMIDLIMSFQKTNYLADFLRAAVQAGNNDIFKHLLARRQDHGTVMYPSEYPWILMDILASDSEDLFEAWENYVDIDMTTCDDHMRKKRLKYYSGQKLIGATAGHPGRENCLLSIWERIGLLKSSNRTSLGSALVNVAATTCSVKLARHLVSYGAEVDYRLSDRYLTPLHHAARQDSAAAAEMMQYLLLQGADPELDAGRSGLGIRDEKGAKAISKWLGMTWDEVVAKAKEERSEIKEQSVQSWQPGSST
ncbi:hypothetical protein LTR84_011894 [Exophiala bonariae]|uniref:Uncharacterized protein n=1 Tax=Exophiala bonariae TaxID=1690606 RepID=A0AAV9NKX3_9EURO|nr:hypothetical protein LTR84_011894 [Exophiala bonariae]